MELTVTGWGRDHGEKILAKRDLTEARTWVPNGYGRAEVYAMAKEAQERTSFGVQVIDKGAIELRFYAKLTLNGEYLVKQTMSRKEVARLFFSQYQDCSLQELIEIYNEIEGVKLSREFAPIMRKQVDEIDLSAETSTWLKINHILLVGDLIQKTETEIRHLPDGERYLSEIKLQLNPRGLTFGTKIKNWPSVPTIYLKRVDELNLTVRTLNCLMNDSVIYLGDLVQKSEDELLRTPNFGRKSLSEIKDVLASVDLHLGMEISDWRSPNH